MRRPRRVMLLLVACWLLVMALILIWPREREPVYQGRSLTEWLVIGNKPRSDEEYRQATEAFRHIGTNAIPWLLKWMSHDLSLWRYKLCDTLNNLPWMGDRSRVESLVLGKHLVRLNDSKCVFAILGPQASPAIPELTRLMHAVPELARAYMFALCFLGQDALPPLVAVLTNQHPGMRCAAAEYIGHMAYLGTNASPALPPLLQCLHDTNADVAGEAAIALGALGLEPEVVVPALTNALQAPQPWLKAAAAQALGNYREKAACALPALVECLGDRRWQVSRRAARALGKIGFQPELIVPAITNRLQDSDWVVRYEVAQVLGEFGAHARSAVPLLLPMLQDSDSRVRGQFTNALLAIAPEVLGKTNRTGKQDR